MMATMSVNAQEDVNVQDNVNVQEEANAPKLWNNEIAVAYGGGSNTDIVGSIGKGMFTGKQLNYWGPISFEYFRRLNKNNKVALGAVVAIAGCKWDDEMDASSKFFTVMPAVKYNWKNTRYFSMYSKIAAGLTIKTESGRDNHDNSQVAFNFQITGFGVEFGKSLRVFAEAGLGEQGIILGGLRYKF